MTGRISQASRQATDLSGFERRLKKEHGKIRPINVCDVYERREKASSYYDNKASDLHAGAVVLWHSYQSPIGIFDPDPRAEELGLGQGFRLNAALPPVFALLAGLSIELQIKAIARLLDLHHLRAIK